MRNVNVIIICAAFIITNASMAEPSTNASDEAAVRIESVRVSRSTPDLLSKFSGRYYSDSTPGVSIQLLLRLKDQVFLPPGRDPVTIDTFIDDTYQNLIGSQNLMAYGGQQPVVSDDGSALLFNVSSGRPPSEDAGRIFVRGKLQARVARGEPQTTSALLILAVGQGTMVGHYRTMLRSIASIGDNGMSLTLAVQGDASRILKIRALDRAGNELSDPRQTRFTEIRTEPTPSYLNPSTAMVTLRATVTNYVTIEYSVAETVQAVSIPFEAQVDIGVAKAGPVEVSKDRAQGRTTSGSPRPWPPPPTDKSAQTFPPRRSAFVPESRTNQPVLKDP